MPETIPLQETTVYGPIHSRRLGNSLGINVLPTSHKVCSSNCVYCQYGWTPSPTRLLASSMHSEPSLQSRLLKPRRVRSGKLVGGLEGRREPLKRAAQLLTEIEAAFREHAAVGTPVDCITLAGNGEPTLHPDLLELVIGLARLRDQYFPSAAVGILTDATQVTRPRVREALARLDVRYMKFDAADETMWRRINLPLTGVSFSAIVEALRAMPDIILQSMFIHGSYDNTDEAHITRWVEAVGMIKPLSVQVYTVDRGTAAPGILEVPRARLHAIADRLTTTTGIPADVFD